MLWCHLFDRKFIARTIRKVVFFYWVEKFSIIGMQKENQDPISREIKKKNWSLNLKNNPMKIVTELLGPSQWGLFSTLIGNGESNICSKIMPVDSWTLILKGHVCRKAVSIFICLVCHLLIIIHNLCNLNAY